MTALRAIPDSMDAATVAAIDADLDRVEAEHGARILLAVESGSRAWGFPSPDSDYDCRFLYVRPLADYLRLSQPRDVIELPLRDVFDVNGWDIAKALRLMLKGNAIVAEWLASPIVYRGDPAFRAQIIAFAAETMRPSPVAHHYMNLGREMMRRNLGDMSEPVKLKKLFYVLRPAMALDWMAAHPGAALAPMDIHRLMAEAPPPDDVRVVVDDLLAVKARTRELGVGPIPAPIVGYIRRAYADAQARWREPRTPPSLAQVEAANRFFARLLGVER